MPDLTLEELREVARRMVAAQMVGDDDAVMAAIEPVKTVTDTYRLIAGLVQIVANTIPASECPVHGADCQGEMRVTFGVLPVMDGDVDTSGLADGELPSLPPELEAAYPGQVAYMRMLVAVLADDEDQLAAVFGAAMHNGHGPLLLHCALENAASTVRAMNARLQ